MNTCFYVNAEGEKLKEKFYATLKKQYNARQNKNIKLCMCQKCRKKLSPEEIKRPEWRKDPESAALCESCYKEVKKNKYLY